MDGHLTAEISASAVRANLTLLRGLVAPGAKLCAVVKSDFYGLGADALLGAVAQLADCLAVATAEEAVELRSKGYGGPVLLLLPAGADANTLDELLARQVTVTVVAPEELSPLVRAAQRRRARAEVHVKIDTGMHRGGADPAGVAELVGQVRSQAGLRLAGLYTHLANADERDLSFAREQLARFRQAVASCGARDGLVLHAANSAAAIQMPEAHLDMIRPGIAVYGYQPGDWMQQLLPLKPALRLWSRLVQVKHVPAGASCGYGLTHTFSRDSRIGRVPVGYADGYFRCLSNKASMRIGGCDVPVVGRVSMDQTILDLTAAPRANIGDVVEIISDDPAAPHSVERLARLAGTIPHELITRLGRRVRRVASEGVYLPETAASPEPAGRQSGAEPAAR